MSGINNAVSLSADSSSLHPRPLLYLTALLVSLSTCAFLLQWHGGLPDLDIDGVSGLSERDKIPASSGDCAEILGQSNMPSFPYYSWRPRSGSGLSENGLKICITSTTSAGIEQILPWILYHKVIGAAQFVLFVEGKAASNNVARVLESIPEVKLVYRTQELEEQQAKSRIWKERWLRFFFNKPCNYELFVRQTFNMETAIVMAREAGMDWIIHIDTDELLHPAGTLNYSLQELLSEVPHNVGTVKFPAYESCVERDDIKEPFSEVSMFKKNYQHLLQETYIEHNLKAAHGNPNYTLTYAIWKSGARIQDGLRPNGAHEWRNYRKEFNTEAFLEEAAVLHYTYTKFSDLKSRRNRCKCKPTPEDLKRCLMIEFDRNAFVIASSSTEEEMIDWYDEHVVWYDTEVKAILLREGVLERIYAPMVIVQGLKESGIFADIIASAWRKHELNQKP